MKPLLQAAALALVLFSASAVSAQTDASVADAIRLAAEAFDQGREAYQAGNYAAAADHFEDADGHAASNKAIEFAIRSRLKAGQQDRAASLAELAIQRYPRDARLKDLAEGILGETADTLHRIAVSCEAPCKLTLDGTPVHGRAETERVVYLTPGKHKLIARFPNQRGAAKLVIAREGGESEASFTQPQPNKTVIPTPDAPKNAGTMDEDEEYWESFGREEERDEGAVEGRGLPPAVFWSGVGLTAVGIGLSSWSYVYAKNNPGDKKIREDCILPDGTPLGTDCRTWKQAKLNELRTNIVIGSTAAVGIATTIIGIWATDWGTGETDSATKQDEAKSSPSVQPWFAFGRGVTAGVTGRF